MLDATLALMLIILFTVLFQCVAEYGWQRPRFTSVGFSEWPRTTTLVAKNLPQLLLYFHIGKWHYCVSYSQYQYWYRGE